MSYLNYDGLAYFKSKFTNWVDQNYLSKTNTGNTTVAGNVTFTNPITGDLDGKAKKDWLDQKIDETYIKNISVNDNAGQIVYTKGNGSSNYIMIDLMHGATASAVGKAGLVPAPKISERDKFLRGDGEWGVPTDVYVTQNMISTNDSFPILIGATAGATTSQVGTPIAFGTRVSVNPYTHTLIADHLILKHPTYRRSSNVSSKIMYTLNFADSNDGNGNNLSEIYGYIDPVSDGGEHELGFRLFGNPNVQGVEEIFTYLSVGLSKTNIPYGHAPKTPVPADHNEDTDIITRSYLALNGSITGLVHTAMPETISGIKTFTDETRNTSTAGITTTKLTASGKITGTGTAEISGGSGNTPSLKVTGNEAITGDLSVGGNETVAGNETVTGNISTANGNISTTNGTISGKTGSIGTGGLTVTGPSNLNGKVTAGNGLDVTGNETVSGNLTIGGITTTEDLHVTDDAVIDDDLTISGDIFKKINNTTQEYVTYVTNQQDVRETIINNLIKANGGLAQDSNKNIYVKTGDGIKIDSNGYVTTRLQANGGLQYTGSTANLKELAINLAINGGLVLQSGAVKVDFSQLPEAQIRAIVDGMIAKDPVTGKYTGGLSTNADGKLIVDFSELPSEVMVNIVRNMVAPGGGLYYVDTEFLQEGETYVNSQGKVKTVTATQAAQTENGFPNPNYGKLLVNFSQIDEDTKADILATLDLQYPLTAHLYITVDPEGVSEDELTLGTVATDSLTHRIGSKTINYTFKERKSIPFKTIQGAVNWVSSRINLASKNAYIEIVGSNDVANPRIYEESVSLPQLATSTGSGIIRTKSGIKDVIIKPKVTSGGFYGHAFVASSGACIWHIYHMIIDKQLGQVPVQEGVATSGIGAQSAGAIVHIHGCDFKVHPEIDPNTGNEREEFIGNSYTIRLIDADGGGTVHIHPDSQGSMIESKLPVINTEGIAIDILNVARDGTMYFRRSNPPTSMYDENDTSEQKAAKDEIYRSVYINGSFTRFIYTWQAGKTNALGGSGLYIKFPVASNGTAVGRPYVLTGGSHIISPEKVYLDNDPESGTYQQYYYVFPGNGDTSIQTSTYCWINTENNYPPVESNNG